MSKINYDRKRTDALRAAYQARRKAEQEAITKAVAATDKVVLEVPSQIGKAA